MSYVKSGKAFLITINMYPSCKIYRGDCIHKDDDVCKTEFNVIAHSGKYNNPTHFKNRLNYDFNWRPKINGHKETWN